MVNLVFVGCEYTGKSTIADLVEPWTEQTFGTSSHFHDHFSVRWAHGLHPPSKIIQIYINDCSILPLVADDGPAPSLLPAGAVQ